MIIVDKRIYQKKKKESTNKWAKQARLPGARSCTKSFMFLYTKNNEKMKIFKCTIYSSLLKLH